MRGTIRKRGKASWELKFDVPSEDGRRKTRYRSFKGTRQEAQRELTKLLGAADAGTLPDPSNATVAEYIDAWLAAPHGSAKTMERYGELAANQIKPHLGVHKLQRLKPEHVQTWHGKLAHAWRRAVHSKKLPAVTFHALRHSHASLLINAGVDILTVSRRLGHANASITLNVYGHLIEGADAAAAKAIGEVLK